MLRQAKATAVLGRNASCSCEGTLCIMLELLAAVHAGGVPPAFAGVRCAVRQLRNTVCLPPAVISEVRTLLQGLAGMGGPSPSSQPAPLLSGMPRGGQAGQSIGDLQPLAARMPRTEAQPLGSALPRTSGYGGAAALGTSNASQPSSLNWFRGDSIRGVDREFIYQVGRVAFAWV